jgi:hypothetical protein
MVPAKDRKEYRTSYLRDIWLQMRKMEREAGTQHRLSNSINFRIYSAWSDAENYHAHSLEKLRKVLS